MIISKLYRGPRRLLRAPLVLMAFLVALTSCSNGLDPDKVSVTGTWNLQTELGATDFHFILEEKPGGLITGNWSAPQAFSFNNITGRREGLDIELVGDSPNIFPMQLTVTFVAKTRMDGHFYFGGTTETVILRRTSVTPLLE